MTRTAALLLGATLVLTSACGKKNTGGDAAAGATDVLKGATLPDDANARAFAANLVTHKAIDIRPTDSGEMSFIYKSLSFTGENNGWLAEAVLGQGQDSIACQEIGDWKVESAESADTATMVWTLNKTTCAGRAANNVMRVKVTIKDGNYDIAFR